MLNADYIWERWTTREPLGHVFEFMLEKVTRAGLNLEPRWVIVLFSIRSEVTVSNYACTLNQSGKSAAMAKWMGLGHYKEWELVAADSLAALVQGAKHSTFTHGKLAGVAKRKDLDLVAIAYGGVVYQLPGELYRSEQERVGEYRRAWLLWLATHCVQCSQHAHLCTCGVEQ